MRNEKALGMVEVYGKLGAVECLDAALKAANTRLVDVVKVGGGLTTVLIEGDVAAVRASVDAGAEAADKVCEVVAVHVIPRPEESVRTMLIPPPVDAAALWKLADALPSEPQTGNDEVVQKTAHPAEPVQTGNDEAAKQTAHPAEPVQTGNDEAAKQITQQKDIIQADTVKTAQKEKPLTDMSVVNLRKLARETQGFPMTRQEIKMAKKVQLLEAFGKIRFRRE